MFRFVLTLNPQTSQHREDTVYERPAPVRGLSTAGSGKHIPKSIQTVASGYRNIEAELIKPLLQSPPATQSLN